MTLIFTSLKDYEIREIIKICNLNNDFFDNLTFVKRNLLKFDSNDSIVEEFTVNQSNII